MLVLLPLILLKESFKCTDTQEAFVKVYVLKNRGRWRERIEIS